MKINQRLAIFTLVLIGVTTFCKYQFGPNINWSGFSPVIAIGLFSGMLIREKSKSFLLPLVAVFGSDVAIQLLYVAGLFPYAGFYTYQVFNYALLLAITLLGWALKGKNYSSIAGGAVIAPTVFFVISNGAAWLIDTGNLYTNDFAGLVTSYKAGLPFYRNAIAGTLISLPLIMLGYNYLVKGTRQLTLA